MHALSPHRLACLLVASLFVLASCGGGDESASSTATTATAPTTEAETVVDDTLPELVEIDDSRPELEGPPVVDVDDRTPREIAIDELDVTMFQLGVTDLEGTANCVIERLESEGVEFTGEGTAEIIALSACDENVISEWLPEANASLPTDTWACTVESIGDWINELSIADAEAFFSASSPPTEFVESTADRCDASVDDITAALS